MLDKEKLKHELLTQDNRITSHPLFIVFQEDYYPADGDFDGDGIMFTSYDSDCQCYDCNDNFKCEDYEECTRYGYWKTKRFVTCCLTNKGAEAYIKANGHNLKNPFIYVESAYRNQEMIDIREYFMKGEN